MVQVKPTNFEKLKDIVTPLIGESLAWESYECIEWIGPNCIVSPLGTRIVARVAYILSHGPISDDYLVLRHCGTQKCIRPVHLNLVGGLATMRRMIAEAPDDDSCIEWPLARDPKGYGRVTRASGGYGFTHREAWMYVKGPITEDICVLHHCDNPPCFRPSHLFTGDRLDNSADALSKGRLLVGERALCAKLTNAEVIEIRNLRNQGVRQIVLANRFGVTESAIADIEHGRTWKSLP